MNGFKNGIIISVLVLIFAFTASSIFLKRNQPIADKQPQINAEFYQQNNWRLYKDEKGYSFFVPGSWRQEKSSNEGKTKTFVGAMCILKVKEVGQLEQNSTEECNSNPKVACELIKTPVGSALLRTFSEPRPFMRAEIPFFEAGAVSLSLDYRSDICIEQFKSLIKSITQI